MKKTIMIHWLDNRAKRIEKKCLNNFGKSLSFISISRILSDNAVIEARQDLGTMIIDIDKFKENQAKYLESVGLKSIK